MGSDRGEFWCRTFRFSWFGHQSELVCARRVPCATGHLPSVEVTCSWTGGVVPAAAASSFSIVLIICFAEGRGKIYLSYGIHRICVLVILRGPMEVHQLRYFCAVARHGTFTRASEVEHIAQPSLSQQILKLEAELGARLFDRLPRSAKLTVFGKAFLPKAERILRELQEAKSELREMSGNEKGEVVVGIIPTIAA